MFLLNFYDLPHFSYVKRFELVKKLHTLVLLFLYLHSNGTSISVDTPHKYVRMNRNVKRHSIAKVHPSVSIHRTIDISYTKSCKGFKSIVMH